MTGPGFPQASEVLTAIVGVTASLVGIFVLQILVLTGIFYLSKLKRKLGV